MVLSSKRQLAGFTIDENLSNKADQLTLKLGKYTDAILNSSFTILIDDNDNNPSECNWN